MRIVAIWFFALCICFVDCAGKVESFPFDAFSHCDSAQGCLDFADVNSALLKHFKTDNSTIKVAIDLVVKNRKCNFIPLFVREVPSCLNQLSPLFKECGFELIEGKFFKINRIVPDLKDQVIYCKHFEKLPFLNSFDPNTFSCSGQKKGTGIDLNDFNLIKGSFVVDNDINIFDRLLQSKDNTTVLTVAFLVFMLNIFLFNNVEGGNKHVFVALIIENVGLAVLKFLVFKNTNFFSGITLGMWLVINLFLMAAFFCKCHFDSDLMLTMFISVCVSMLVLVVQLGADELYYCILAISSVVAKIMFGWCVSMGASAKNFNLIGLLVMLGTMFLSGVSACSFYADVSISRSTLNTISSFAFFPSFTGLSQNEFLVSRKAIDMTKLIITISPDYVVTLFDDVEVFYAVVFFSLMVFRFFVFVAFYATISGERLNTRLLQNEDALTVVLVLFHYCCRVVTAGVTKFGFFLENMGFRVVLLCYMVFDCMSCFEYVILAIFFTMVLRTTFEHDKFFIPIEKKTVAAVRSDGILRDRFKTYHIEDTRRAREESKTANKFPVKHVKKPKQEKGTNSGGNTDSGNTDTKLSLEKYTPLDATEWQQLQRFDIETVLDGVTVNESDCKYTAHDLHTINSLVKSIHAVATSSLGAGVVTSCNTIDTVKHLFYADEQGVVPKSVDHFSIKVDGQRLTPSRVCFLKTFKGGGVNDAIVRLFFEGDPFKIPERYEYVETLDNKDMISTFENVTMVFRTVNSTPGGYNLWPYGDVVLGLPAYKFTTIKSDSGCALFVKDPCNGGLKIMGLHSGKVISEESNVCIPYFLDSSEPEFSFECVDLEMLRLGDQKDEALVKLEKDYTKAVLNKNVDEQKRILPLIKQLVELKKLMIIKPDPVVYNTTTNLLASPVKDKVKAKETVKTTSPENADKKKLLRQIKGLIKRAESVTAGDDGDKIFTWSDYDKVGKLLLEHGSVSKETQQRWTTVQEVYTKMAKGKDPLIKNGKHVNPQPKDAKDDKQVKFASDGKT
jgi:hypothetical protein